MARIQVVIDEREREEFRAQAVREGRSLSEWLREAGRERLAKASRAPLRTAADLEEFFEGIDRRHAGEPPEEDWPVHKARIEAGRTAQLPRSET